MLFSYAWLLNGIVKFIFSKDKYLLQVYIIQVVSTHVLFCFSACVELERLDASQNAIEEASGLSK